MNKTIKIVISVLVVLVMADLVFLNLRFFLSDFLINKSASVIVGVAEEKAVPTPIDFCGPVCKQTIIDEVKREVEKAVLIAGESGTKAPQKNIIISTVPLSKQVKVAYIPLISEGLSTSVTTDWVDVVPSEFDFDLIDYQGVKEVRLNAYLMAVNGSAKVFMRLYDLTNKRGVDYSEIQTQNSEYSFLESSAMKIWKGNNRYKIQLRSVNGNEVRFKDAKLKINF